jgi:DNA replication ATP-dependent helicase Dna2
MPMLTKEALSRYVRTGCKRQLRLYLAPDTQRFATERAEQGMPQIQPPRPGLPQIVEQGREWQRAKVADLENAFGAAALVGNARVLPGFGTQYGSMPLRDALAAVPQGPGCFIVEGEFPIGPAFEQGLGVANLRLQFGLEYAQLRPDLIEVAAPGTFAYGVAPSGEVTPLDATDPRLQLRVIDIKLTAEPSASYMMEVALYTIALAGWLVDVGLDDQYLASSETAVWPGSHEASNLTLQLAEWQQRAHTPNFAELHDALGEDLEPVPFEVFAMRIRRLLQEDVAEVLAQNWRELPWHVDNSCKGCEYLGAPWISRGEPTWVDDHCRPEAERNAELSRVAFVGRGATAALREAGVSNTHALAEVAADAEVFDSHHVLRATRTVVASRAGAIDGNTPATIAPQSGTSAIMPRWADLRISLSVDFDPGSAITFAFGLKAFWVEPYRANQTQRDTQAWPARSFVVDHRSLPAEERELLNFLGAINDILTTARAGDPETTVQFYVWDQLEAKHLARVVGRHLEAILARGSLQYLAWLFPPDELLPNPTQSTRRSPLTIVRDVVRAVVAAPVAHYYALLPLARTFHSPRLPQHLRDFNVHPLFEDYLGDQIPAERAHEIWSRSAQPPWLDQVNILQRTVARRLSALETIRERLEDELRPVLGQTAPRINVAPPDWQSRLSLDGQLWYAFARLNEAFAELDVHQVRAMPPHEREARFHSARLEQRLTGDDEREAQTALGLTSRVGRRVYRLAEGSREVKLREGDFDRALAPADEPGFLDRSMFSLVRNTPLVNDLPPWPIPLDQGMGVTVVTIDRERRLLVLDPSRRYPTFLDDVEQEGLVDLSREVTLDPTHADFFTRKLRETLRAIGNPPIARDSPSVARALGRLGRRQGRRTAHTPAADVLWDAQAMHAARLTRSIAGARAALEADGLTLNESQWRAWEEALTRRLQLLWGPPGTGKSRTMRAIGDGAAVAAAQASEPLRILICSSTYTAVDNVLLPIYGDLTRLLPEADLVVRRLRSYSRLPDREVPTEIDLELDRREPSPAVYALRERLLAAEGITVVAATPQQVHNLLMSDDGSPQQELFDLILFDEGTQLDVAHAILAIAALAAGGAVVVAGDPLQLPPIHPAEAPLGLEALVGSFYSFCAAIHQVPEQMLEENYRSNATLVSFSRRAGYRDALESYSPELALDLAPGDGSPPSGWPAELIWSPELEDFLNPANPAVCFVYPDARASQWNRFEADTVAALAFLLRGRLRAQLANERDPATGLVIPTGEALHDDLGFWSRGVGIVTPHRAQQGLIIARLQHAFGADGELSRAIRGAVDTVERFQGQQRDVIIASFALGDPDAIRDEEEFLLSLNRFNVMASRARAKLITLVSRDVVDHLANDIEVVRASRLLKVYVDSFCNIGRAIALRYRDGARELAVEGEIRYHG